MKISFKYLFFSLISIFFLLNCSIFIYLHYQFIDDEQFEEKILDLNSNEFLVLDWTAREHIFQEKDPISCNFSHITPLYCQSKSSSIQQCTHLSNLTVRWTRDRSRFNQAQLISYHSIHMPIGDLPKLNSHQFSMVYILESEARLSDRHYWDQIDFPMWYHLNYSYPEPITYFDLRTYLQYLFSPIRIPFSEKNPTSSIVWISSNCGAYNGRYEFIKKLMSYIRIDSYGKCLNNQKILDRNLNSQIYSSYKFVLAIENSNCEDYITEKLIQAFESTSIPIVAGRNNKPDYTHFAPKYSYINIYDYSSIKSLAGYINYLSSNETAYNEYLWFRKIAHKKMSLNQYLDLADEVFGMNSSIRQWLLTKETSRNKYCKLTEFIHTTNWQNMTKRKRFNRPTASQVCLPKHDLVNYFS